MQRTVSQNDSLFVFLKRTKEKPPGAKEEQTAKTNKTSTKSSA